MFALVRTNSKQLISGFCLSRKLFVRAMAKKSAILLMADGAEEMEAVITADVLRRAGIAVTIASITGNDCIKCSRDVKICADAQLDAVKNDTFDAVILPGGLGGSKALASSKEVGELLKKQENEGRVIAAICAAPTALKAHGIAQGKQITSYPSMKDQLTDYYKYLEDIVVTDGNIITSRGPATAYAFGLAIVEKLLNKEAAVPVAKGMLYENYK
ncbi:protein dj-1beta-like [Microplitis mediator]|uniref:protein dj-1beta-like n=1 Tax=Microplitis mediator TaxID=375433 RepID=UPI002552DE7E|nr:protein dj-1beta-like [Microplitis mediator]